MEHRVVVTGLGAITPLGCDVPATWSGMKAGKCGIAPIRSFDTGESKVKLAAESDFAPEDYMEKKEAKRMDRFCQMGMAAAKEAIEDAGLMQAGYAKERIGVLAGSGIGGLKTFDNEERKMMNSGMKRVSPFLIPMMICNILSGNIAIKYGLKGHCSCVVTACSTGNHAIGDAYQLIRYGKLDAVVAGGSEAAICAIAVGGFANMTALSTSEDPARASIPFDRERNGFVMGEGAGMLVLEEYEQAVARGAHIYGEIVGYGSTCDAYHITSPDPTGDGARRAMELALSEYGLAPSALGYINAHGTSTPLNDATETKAIRMVMGDAADGIPVSSTKSMTGHLLGAAGAVEAIVCLKAMEDQFLPPTIGYRVKDEACDLDVIPNVGRTVKGLTFALSNSFGFGGHNASLLFKRIER